MCLFLFLLHSVVILSPAATERRTGIAYRYRNFRFATGHPGVGTTWLPALFVASFACTSAAAPLTSAYLCRSGHRRRQSLSRFYLFVSTVLILFFLTFHLIPHTDGDLSLVNRTLYGCFYLWVRHLCDACLSVFQGGCSECDLYLDDVGAMCGDFLNRSGRTSVWMHWSGIYVWPTLWINDCQAPPSKRTSDLRARLL